MLRILQVVGGLSRGGTESVVMNYYRNINRKEIQFDFVSHHPELNDYEEEIIKLGGRIFYMPEFKGINIIAYCQAWRQFFLNHPDYTIIHSHAWSTAAIYLQIARKNGLFTISHSHSVSARKGLSAIGRRLFKIPLKNAADYYMACSDAAATWLFGTGIRNKKNFTILPNAINLDEFRYDGKTRKELRRELHVEDGLIIGHVGTFDSNKNQEFIIELFHNYYEVNPKAVLWLIGDGPYINKLKKKVEILGDPVVFWGVRDDVPKLLQAVDIFLFPSHFESFGNAALEAQAAGLRVLCSDSVPDEVAVTDLISFLPLDKPKLWIKQLMAYHIENRDDSYYRLKGTKYDIEIAAKWLQEFYLLHADNKVR